MNRRGGCGCPAAMCCTGTGKGSNMAGLFSSLHRPAGPVEYLICGLGNPGAKYDQTHHNAGFMALDRLAAHTGVTVDRLKFHALTAAAELGGKRVLLMKPQTYMNNSGEAVAEAMRFYKLRPEQLIVLSDDISLAPGRVRIRKKGSAGGHNGLKSIIALIGSEDFPRVKLGIGGKPPQWDLADWVLSEFRGADAEAFGKVLDEMPELCALLVQGQIEQAMNRFNS